ncbi:MAG: hypothetical protein QOG90_1746 [Actinomycetota bacterium]|jgi:uncharacterized protein YdeI (YjbR/CyaY-like superfamily)
MASIDDDPIVYVETPAKFDAWLKKNHTTSGGIWLALAKKNGTKKSPTYVEAVEVALCWGWIDGQKKKLDDDYSLQRFTPRRPRSKWSQTNVDRVSKLIKDKRMQPAGLAEVEKAKADGRWDEAYAPASTIGVPDDLAAALAKNPQAEAFFKTITAANRYAILYRITTVKKPETRARNIEKFVAMLAEGKTLY